MSDKPAPTYRFKHGYDVPQYLAGRREYADRLRAEARRLNEMAETVEAEASHVEALLVRVPPP